MKVASKSLCRFQKLPCTPPSMGSKNFLFRTTLCVVLKIVVIYGTAIQIGLKLISDHFMEE